MVTSFKHVVRVNRDDVEQPGARFKECSIARRLLRSLRARFRRWRSIEVVVGRETALVSHLDSSGKKVHHYCELPAEGKEMVARFDDHRFAGHQAPSPLTFTVRFWKLTIC